MLALLALELDLVPVRTVATIRPMFDSTWHFDAVGPGGPSRRPLRVLVTGVDSLVGCNLADWFARRASVVGLYRDHAVTLPECQLDRWEWTRPSALARNIREAKPHWIIHCGPLACGSWDRWNDVDRLDDALERAVCQALVKASQRVEARLTVLSTDAVFSGPRMFHDEDSPALGKDAFARGAIAVERTLEEVDALVVRTHAYGWSPRDDEPSFAEQVWRSVTEGLPCEADPNAYATPILAADLAERLHRAYERRLRGVYHIAGAERVSAARFAGELASLAGLPLPDRLFEATTPGLSASESLRETSLNTRRAQRDLAYSMPLLRQGLAGLLAQLRDGTRERLRGRLTSRAHAEAA